MAETAPRARDAARRSTLFLTRKARIVTTIQSLCDRFSPRRQRIEWVEIPILRRGSGGESGQTVLRQSRMASRIAFRMFPSR